MMGAERRMYLMSSSYKPSDIDVESRYWDRSCHEVPVRIAKDVACACCNLSILAKKSELVAYLY
jgi:hypothetical protein